MIRPEGAAGLRPHITKLRDGWVCKDKCSSACGWGSDPSWAYSDWKFQVENLSLWWGNPSGFYKEIAP